MVFSFLFAFQLGFARGFRGLVTRLSETYPLSAYASKRWYAYLHREELCSLLLWLPVLSFVSEVSLNANWRTCPLLSQLTSLVYMVSSKSRVCFHSLFSYGSLTLPEKWRVSWIQIDIKHNLSGFTWWPRLHVLRRPMMVHTCWDTYNLNTSIHGV